MRHRAPVEAHLRFVQARDELARLDLAERFRRIYETNLWGAAGTRSGLGSEPDATATLRAALPEVIARLGARRLLDIPCGDFGWMSKVDLGECEYIGADIVPELVARNQAIYGSAGRRFVVLDLTAGPLPRADAVLCRDCLSTPTENLTVPPIENLTDRRGDEPQFVAAS